MEDDFAEGVSLVVTLINDCGTADYLAEIAASLRASAVFDQEQRLQDAYKSIIGVIVERSGIGSDLNQYVEGAIDRFYPCP